MVSKKKDIKKLVNDIKAGKKWDVRKMVSTFPKLDSCPIDYDKKE